MIQIQQKPFEVVFWQTEDRSSTDGAFRMAFDTLSEAQAEFAARQQSGQYRAGILMEWHKLSGEWKLVERYPR